MLQEVLTVVTPVFVIAGIGYLWARADQPFDTNTVGSLVMMIGSPCLIYSSLTTNAPQLDDLAKMAFAALFVIVGGVIVSLGILKLTGWKATTYLGAMVHPNGGNMGLPICLLAFGDVGLALGMAYFFVNSISQYTLGLSVASGHFDVAQLARQPVIWAVIITLTVLVTGVQLPQWINSTTSILAGLTIPAMLLMLGTSLARLNIADVRQTLSVAVIRIVLGGILAVVVIWLFDLSGVLAGVVLLQATMPSAVFNFVFAERYNREPDKVAAVILQSTIISIVSLPLLVAWALNF